MAPGIWQFGLVILLVVLLFGGRGKISSIMGDFAKGITSFRRGLRDNEETSETKDDAPGIAEDSRDDTKAGS
ncbi:Sec-independent protein translocase TatA [Maricaulis sp. D1M11]|uniref:Sec-independent protein translocase TatA n=1 Tax=Maricaulis sp. D1M11 TaxID=3076117 RepID=UPI0039B512C7